MFGTNGYLGFTFAGRHSSEFGLLVVSDGSRYHQNSFAQFFDSVITVPGKNGGYYFGTQLGQKDFDINCVFDNITPHTIHKIQHWLYPNVVGWLIFDEQPYKKYLVKLSTNPVFNYIPFDEFKTAKNYSFQKEVLKGEVNFSFFCMEEYGIYNNEYELPKIDQNELIPQQALDSGLIPNNFIRKWIYLPHEEIYNYKDDNNIYYFKADKVFSLYNAGNGISKADFYIIIDKEKFSGNNGAPLEIMNYNDGIKYIITNPIETIKKKYKELEDNNYQFLFIEILSSKQEVYATVLNSSKNKIEGIDRVNIGAHYNHFFPKVYHTKPTEFCIFTQVVNKNGSPESLFYTFSYDENDLGSSDTQKKQYTFEEFQKYWNDYTILTKYNTFNINNIISPAVIFIDYPEDYNYIKNNERILQNELGYLIYPNKYSCNHDLISFIAEYDHTYI